MIQDAPAILKDKYVTLGDHEVNVGVLKAFAMPRALVNHSFRRNVVRGPLGRLWDGVVNEGRLASRNGQNPLSGIFQHARSGVYDYATIMYGQRGEVKKLRADKISPEVFERNLHGTEYYFIVEQDLPTRGRHLVEFGMTEASASDKPYLIPALTFEISERDDGFYDVSLDNTQYLGLYRPQNTHEMLDAMRAVGKAMQAIENNSDIEFGVELSLDSMRKTSGLRSMGGLLPRLKSLESFKRRAAEQAMAAQGPECSV